MSRTMRIVRIVEGTSVDGPGLRTSIYFAGCAHRCPECHNPQTWDFKAGCDMSVEEVMATVLYNEAPVTFSGGDPVYQAAEILPLARGIKEAGLNLWCYTGFTFEQLQHGIPEVPAPVIEEFLGLIDVLVDGPFIIARRDTDLRYRGSSNQRLVDVQESLRTGKTVEYQPTPAW